MQKSIKKFCLLSALATLPFWIIFLLYICLDPFKVIWSYHPYFKCDENNYVGWNKGYISTEAYNYNNPNQHYNSFIFGSSRSIEYQAKEWSKYIPKNSRIFHFDASMETIKGIYEKMKYIESKDEKIEEALIILDPEMLSRKEQKNNQLYVPHPDLTQEWDYLSFQWQFFKVFLTQNFIISYIDLKVNGFQDYMRQKELFTSDNPDYDPITNEEEYRNYDSLLSKNAKAFYTSSKIYQFNLKRSQGWDTAPQFDKDNLQYLKKIEEILNKEGTDYKIIIPPLYNQQYLNAQDKAALIKIFGEDKIKDFAGDNEYTNDMHNFYDENSHARPFVCRKILENIYLE